MSAPLEPTKTSLAPANAEVPRTTSSRHVAPAAAVLRVVGLNHRTTPLGVRERFAIDKDGHARALERALAVSGAKEAVLLSTCNRVELYGDVATDQLARFFGETAALSGAELEKCLYRHEGAEAVAHLFRVAASLDSLVLGEDQILNQVKNAYELAQKTASVGGLLHPTFQAAIKAGKRVRRDTKIGERMLSVSSVAVDFVQKVFSDLRDRSVLLIGAGEAARLTLVHLRARGVGAVRIANRSVENAAKLAQELGGEPVSMDALADELGRADIVLTSVGAPRPLVTSAMVSKALKTRRGRQIFFLDIAVPRDIEPAVEQLGGVFLYNLDDLQAIVRENYGKRTEDLDAAFRVVSEEVERHLGRERHRRLGPLIAEVKERLELSAHEEVRALLDRLELSPEQRAALDGLGEQLARQLLHAPLTAIREEAQAVDDDGPHRLLERMLRHLPQLKSKGTNRT